MLERMPGGVRVYMQRRGTMRDGMRGRVGGGTGGVRRRQRTGRGRMQLGVRGGGGMDMLGSYMRTDMVQ